MSDYEDLVARLREGQRYTNVLDGEMMKDAATAIETLLRERDADRKYADGQKAAIDGLLDNVKTLAHARDAAIKERDELRDCNYELQNVTEQICIEKIVKERDAAIARASSLDFDRTAAELNADALRALLEYMVGLCEPPDYMRARIDAALKGGEDE